MPGISGRQSGVCLPLIMTTILLMAVAGPAAAELQSEAAVDYTDMSLEDLFDVDVVYGASRYQQKTSEAPASVTVITAEDITDYGWRTLADVLNSLRGFYTTYDRNYHYVGVRGFGRPGDYNSRLLVLVDGIRANENIYGSASMGTDFFLDLDLVERIEVVRGPSSSIYGANAVFGVVNVVTKDGHRIDGVQASGSVGSFGAWSGRVTAGSSVESDLNWLVSGTFGETDGQDLAYPEFGGTFHDGDTDRWRRALAKVSYGPWRAEALYSWRRKWVPTAPWGTIFDDPRTRTDDELGLVTGGYRGGLDADTELSANLTYGYYEYVGDWIYDYADPGDPLWAVLSKDDARGRWLDADLSANRTLGGGHRVAVGADFRRNMKQDQNVWDEDPHWTYLADRRSSENWGAHALAEVRAAAWLLINAGLRYDHYSTFGGTTHPRVAVVSEVKSGTIVKVLYGSAFREPNAYELYYHDGGETTKANPGLQPETMRTWELILEQTLAEGVKGTLAGFWFENRDLIDQHTDPADDLDQYINEDEVRSPGYEAELDGRLDSGLRGRASYSYQRAYRGSDGALLTNSPRHMAKLNVSVPVWRPRTTLGCELQYASGRGTGAGAMTGDNLLVNLTVVQRSLYGGLEVRGSVYNLFDEEYGHPGGLEHEQDILLQDGRSFRLQVVLSR